ncbi:hypothetical protein P3X46_012482 [Hevea brasiliensis]|uniref:EF-hand domain-containing protein n=1 Tax=Hevea brasiliensis TaxID=3981 RepID=A0ABQ9MAC8_HEVBR|nr:hypothetical protein P3X46_012482 [Hevea brasiliensis]
MAIVRYVQIQPSRERKVEEFKAWLRQFDIDCDGCLSREDLKEALHSMRIRFAWWKARQAMKEADTNGNGQVNNPKEI